MPRLSTLTLLKVIIVFGVLLIIGGHTLLVTDSFRDYFGIYSFMIGAVCIAVGLIMSLPTKIYLTILLMRNEGKESKFK
ncbi:MULTISPECIES: hypothetical protein [unclassified Pseudoalteromonas]|uniref:hypothetical protein n=1 Tax=unclassified Pseudoalteromonas TaxID=194690 RepID=UPI000CF6DCEC|nr:MULTISPECIES: hypothetical protein [unclassified Pseudoalteromonas]